MIVHQIKLKSSWKIDDHLKSGDGTQGRWLGLLLGSDVGFNIGCSVLIADDANTSEKMTSVQNSNQNKVILLETLTAEVKG